MNAVYSRSRSRGAFTLVELLVVITIIGILIALLLPAVQAAREAARRGECSNNLKQIALSLHGYHGVHKCFPPGVMAQNPFPYRKASWLVRILPFMEQTGIYERATFNDTDWTGQNYIDRNANLKHQTLVPAFNCPSSLMPPTYDQGTRSDTQSQTPPAPASIKVQIAEYAGIAGTYYAESDMSSAPVPNATASYGGRSTFNGVMASVGGQLPNPVTFALIADGSSNTACIGEESSYYFDSNGTKIDGRAGYWAGGMWTCGPGGDNDWWLNVVIVRYPINWNGAASYHQPGYHHHTIIRSSHPGGAQIALSDGAVRFVQDGIDFRTLTRLCDRNDGQPIGEY